MSLFDYAHAPAQPRRRRPPPAPPDLLRRCPPARWPSVSTRREPTRFRQPRPSATTVLSDDESCALLLPNLKTCRYVNGADAREKCGRVKLTHALMEGIVASSRPMLSH